ncbi:hypothetical protein [Streptomyces sp. NPDC001714]|uniref:hypothetical protein n=1 Tax=Streptomyces sp. NPDC001714 TaxID=3364603 RepID=UPI0036A01C60
MHRRLRIAPDAHDRVVGPQPKRIAVDGSRSPSAALTPRPKSGVQALERAARNRQFKPLF